MLRSLVVGGGGSVDSPHRGHRVSLFGHAFRRALRRARPPPPRPPQPACGSRAALRRARTPAGGAGLNSSSSPSSGIGAQRRRRARARVRVRRSARCCAFGRSAGARTAARGRWGEGFFRRAWSSGRRSRRARSSKARRVLGGRGRRGARSSGVDRGPRGAMVTRSRQGTRLGSTCGAAIDRRRSARMVCIASCPARSK